MHNLVSMPVGTSLTRGIPSYTSLLRLPNGDVPLKLALAWLVICATPMSETGQQRGYYSSNFLADVLDVVSREAFDVNPSPATFAALRAETDALVRRETRAVARLVARRHSRGQAVPEDLEVAAEFHSWMESFKDQFADMNPACMFIDGIERDIRNRINEHEEELEGSEPIEKRSPLGLFFRKLMLVLRKLSFDDTTVLAAHVGEWCGQEMSSRTGLPWGWLHNRERIETTGFKENMVSMAAYTSALAMGDYAAAMVALRRFYDYQLSHVERPMHHHALLNVATFHYNTGGFRNALEAIDQAVSRARKAGDSQCLHKCEQLEYRIKLELNGAAWPGYMVPSVKDQRIPSRRLQDNKVAGDEMWSIKAAIDLGEPVHVAFRRVYTGMALGYDFSAPDAINERQDLPPAPRLSPALWHGVQAGLWNMIGSSTLASIHEDMAFTSPDLDDETRLEVLLARADRMCEEGRADDGLALLIDRSTVDAMALAEYRRWSGGVWSVLERAAVLDGDGDALTVISGLRGSASLLRLGPGGPVREAFDPAILPTTSAKGIIFAHGEVSAALRRSEKLLSAAAPAHHVLPEVLAALQLARALALWPLHAQATLAFAETLLAMDLPAKAEAEAAAVWEQLRGAGVPRGALVRAKAAAAMALDALDARAARENATVSEDDAAAEVADPAPLFAQAARYADLALSRATDLGLRTLHRDARTLRTMLAEVAGIPFPRSAAADLPPPNGVERARRIGEIVRLVGVRVSEGWK